jgi:hypothetical protein
LMKLLKFFEGKCCAVRRDRIYSLLSLCRMGEKIRVDYNASDIDLILQVLHACKEEMCFCTAASVARIVRGSNFPHSDTEANSVCVVHDFQLTAVPADTEKCPVCATRPFWPLNMRDGHGVYFCLKGIDSVCIERHGHIFCDPHPTDEIKRQLTPNTAFWFQPVHKRLDPRVLCRKGSGIDVKPCETEDDLYTLSFSLGALVDLEEPIEPIPGYSLHTCRH